MREMKTTIVNEMGLHARPAALLVKLAAKFVSQIWLVNGSSEVNGKSIMGVLTLAAECGSEIVVKADGDDSEAAVTAIVELINSGFGEIADEA
jgi:phosphocarrier protein HPr